MKLFIVDFCNCLELSHFETFFYQNIREGNLSVFPKPLSSFSQFDLIHKWLLEEINRNPFSITAGLVVFYIPRNLTQRLTYYEIDNTAKIYIREMIAAKLDARFSYVCVYVDQTGKDTRHEKAYQVISNVCRTFSSDDPAMKRGMLPKAELASVRTVPELQTLIRDVRDDTVQDFFQNVLSIELAAADPASDSYDTGVINSFFQNCSKKIQPIRSMHVSYFGGDISRKTETLLKLITYVCDFAAQEHDLDFESTVKRFMDAQEYETFDPNYAEIKKRIVTYKKRLSDWLDASNPSAAADAAPVHALLYHETDQAQSFKHRIETIITADYAREILNPSMDELDDFRASERVFSALDQTIEHVDQQLQEFCDGVVRNMYDFRKDNDDAMTEEAPGAVYSKQETDELAGALDQLNQYDFNELPGYSEELKLRQELDLLSEQIQFIGRRIKAARPKVFLATLAFAVVSIMLFYFAAQYSIFDKEDTWWVFLCYSAVCCVVFSVSYFLLRSYYKHRVRALLNECRLKVHAFLESYKKRAQEFEANMNRAMRYSCVQDKHYKLSDQRYDKIREDERFQWHKLKIMSILENLKFFDGFTAGVKYVEEANVPAIPSADTPYLHDAAHCEFYQMRIYRT